MHAVKYIKEENKTRNLL